MKDVLVVGAGPNGLVAALELARSGLEVEVLEAAPAPGGGLASGEFVRPGFVHDRCASVMPLAVLSPAFARLEAGLRRQGFAWAAAPRAAAHLGTGPPVFLDRSLEATAAALAGDAGRWRRLFEPLVHAGPALFEDLLGPLPLRPRRPLGCAWMAWKGLRSFHGLARSFRGRPARELLAGLAAHAFLPLERAPSASFALVLGLSAHLRDWPFARGGSGRLARALAALLEERDVTIRCGVRLRRPSELPPARAVVFDLTAWNFARFAEGALPEAWLRRLRALPPGPGVFQVHWALDGPVPWRDPRVGEASTVHFGTLEEIAAAEAACWRGRMPERPFLLLTQPTAADPGRAPAGGAAVSAYAHVPLGWAGDATALLEARIEEQAPGFRERILARRPAGPRDLEARNPNLRGGSLTGGAPFLRHLFARPVSWRRPWDTPRPDWFLASASTPPGGGIHGMAGWHAARRVRAFLGLRA